MNYSIPDLVGNVGVVLIVGSYFLVQIGRISSRAIPYTTVNALGAAFILYSLVYEFNLSAFIIEAFWLLISLLGLGRIYLERRREG